MIQLTIPILYILMRKGVGVLLSSLGAFFFFDAYKTHGFSTAIIPTVFISLIIIMAGLYVVWVMAYSNEKWNLSLA